MKLKIFLIIVAILSLSANAFLVYKLYSNKKNLENTVTFDSNSALMYSFVRNGCYDEQKMLAGMNKVAGVTDVGITEEGGDRFVTAIFNDPFGSPYQFKENLNKYTCKK